MTEETGRAPSGGFTVRRRFQAGAERLFAAFVEPSRLEQWFVVPGFRTPAERMSVDPRPGGRMEAVMVSDADGSELPFGFEYTEVDPPRRVAFRFEEPDELVTVTLSDAGDDGVDLAYEFLSRPAPTDMDASRRGVEAMLDLIDEGVRRGSI